MRFLTLSDTHGKHRLLKDLPPADVIIHAGDLSKDGREHSVIDFLNWFSKLDYQYKIFIPGNHDFYFEQESAAYLKKMIPANVICLNDSGVNIDGINIWGSPITPWFMDWAFNRERGKDINKHWKLIPADTNILVTHGPALGILDQLVSGDQVGCADLLKHVKRVKPQFHICGHVHEACGVESKFATTFINASILDEHYNLKNKPVEFTV